MSFCLSFLLFADEDCVLPDADVCLVEAVEQLTMSSSGSVRRAVKNTSASVSADGSNRTSLSYQRPQLAQDLAQGTWSK